MKKLQSEYRDLAQMHLQHAERFLGTEDVELHRTACLELRLCIEAICYGLFSLYREELSRSALSKWQPRKVLDELLKIDPYATSPATLSIQNSETGEWQEFGGPEHRFSIEWAKKAYNSLGSVLHMPSLVQLDSAQDPDQYKKKAGEFLPELDKVLMSSAWHLHFVGPTATFTCDCKQTVKRRLDKLHVGATLTCSACGRTYDVETETEDRFRIKLRRIEWQCECGTENTFPEFEAIENYKVECRQCGKPARLRRVWAMFQEPGLSVRDV